MNIINENKILKIIIKIIKTAILIFLLGFILVVCLQRFSNNKISFFKYRMFIVVSGSMYPVYDIGDVLIAKEVKPSTIKVGDAISYEGKVGDLKGKVITHEVIKIDYDKDSNKYKFHAKGRANVIEDPIVSEEQLYGIVIHKTLLLSMIYKIIGTQLGFFLAIIIPLLYIFTSEIIGFLLEREAKRRG